MGQIGHVEGGDVSASRSLEHQVRGSINVEVTGDE